MIKAIVFDYFGVLSTDSYWDDVSNSAQLLGEGIVLEEQHKMVNDGDISWQQYCEFIAKEFGKTVDEVSVAHEKQVINKQVAAYCLDLKNRGLKVGLLSNANNSFLQPILADTHIDKIFDVIVVSSEVGHSKPHPLIYKEILTKLGVDPAEAIMVDDSQVNVEGAESVGMQGLLFLNLAQAKQELETSLADTNN